MPEWPSRRPWTSARARPAATCASATPGSAPWPSRGAAAVGFVSTVLDAQQKVHWLRAVVAHSAAAPGSRLLVSIRTGSTPSPDGTWTRWRSVATEGSGFRAPGRYLQFRLRLAAPRGDAFTVTAVGFSHDGTLPVMVPEGG